MRFPRSSLKQRRIAALTGPGVPAALLFSGCASYGPGGLPVDALGRLQKTEQVLEENNFLALRPGMTKEDVLR